MLAGVVQAGYRQAAAGGYVCCALSPLELEYREVEIDETVRALRPGDLALLPGGSTGAPRAGKTSTARPSPGC